MATDSYFGRGGLCDFYRQVHADCGVETAQYLDDLWQQVKRDRTYEGTWKEVSDFYFAHSPLTQHQQHG